MFARHFALALLAVCLVLVSAAAAVAIPISTTVSTFTGGDAGEGLDLAGDFRYGVNARGPGGDTVRQVTFTDDSEPGVTMIAENEILNWGGSQPEYGATTNDNNLEDIMNSIRWTNTGDGGLEVLRVNLAGLVVGGTYKLQLLFGDDDGGRGWDVFAEGQLIVDDFSLSDSSGNFGDLITHKFVADDETLNILFDGAGQTGIDNNPILNAFTLEVLFEPVVPEPGTGSLAALGFATLVATARRRKRRGAQR